MIRGEPGQDGQDGLTPHVGENNNWWIGETDTGVSATGPTGPAGDSITITDSSTDADGNVVIEFSDGNKVVIPAGQDGKDGDSITVVGSEFRMLMVIWRLSSLMEPRWLCLRVLTVKMARQ